MLCNFPREIGLRRNICDNRQGFDNYVSQFNGKASCYTSLYSFEQMHPLYSWKTDPDSVVIDRAWWDFDTPEGGCLSDVKESVRTLVNRLNGDVRLVFTGRGFHVHQIFQKPLFGLAASKHLERYQKKKAGDLPTLDGVGHPQKLTRIPDTFNPKRNKWSVNIPTKLFADDPHNFLIPTSPVEEYKVLDPFRGMVTESNFDIIKWIAKNPVQEIIHSTENFEGEIGTADLVPIPPCLQATIHHENPKHTVRLALAQHLIENLRWFAHPSTLSTEQKHGIVEEVVSFISTLGWRDFNINTTRHHVNSIMNYEYAPNKCVVDAGPCWAHEERR